MQQIIEYVKVETTSIFGGSKVGVKIHKSFVESQRLEPNLMPLYRSTTTHVGSSLDFGWEWNKHLTAQILLPPMEILYTKQHCFNASITQYPLLVSLQCVLTHW
jgi:hypothetical protein